MAAKYDFFPTPQPKSKEPKERYHARLVVEHTYTNKDIAEEISKRSTIRKAEVMAVFDELAEFFLKVRLIRREYQNILYICKNEFIYSFQLNNQDDGS